MTKGKYTALVVLFTLCVLCPVKSMAQNIPPVADAGLPRYAAQDPVVLDGTGSFDPDNSGPLSYTWWQISGPSVVITDANTATPTISGFVQTDEIQECEFELLVSDGELTSPPDTVKVIIVTAFGANTLQQLNPPFDPNKPTIVGFGGGYDCDHGRSWLLVDYPPHWNWKFDSSVWEEKANFIVSGEYYVHLYKNYGDMLIVYLSSQAPDYKQPIQTMGISSGGQPAIDVAIYLNQTYSDRRYTVNRVSLLDATGFTCRNYRESIDRFLASAVEGEQCWIDSYQSTSVGSHSMKISLGFHPNVLNVGFERATDSSITYWERHFLALNWFGNSLTGSDMNEFNNGIVAGAYWSVIGPGKNLQLASTPDAQTYKFKWYGWDSSGYMDFYDEPNHPGRLPEPVTLVGPADGAIVDANGALLSCEESENAVGYQLLFGPDPYSLVYLFSDTHSPPTEIITTFPFEETWWTVKVRDQYGSTIYADPVCIYAEDVKAQTIENASIWKTYSSIQNAINDAHPGDEIVVSLGICQYIENIDFKGKNLTVRSTDPNDPAIVAATVINGGNQGSVVTFSGSEDANCVLAGLTITGGKRGIYCSGASPTITNCTIAGNGNADMGAGMYIKDGSSPTLVNCTFSKNSASMMGGGMYNENSSPILMNCTFSGNSSTYFGGGIYCAGGSLALTNCILWGDTPNEIFMFGTTPVITYSEVQGGFTGEGNIDADPLFADPNNGDYHLKSQAGRWDANTQTWVVDDVTSPCIDAGNPGTPIGLEPLPNGGIINMGAYGGTDEASKSPEN